MENSYDFLLAYNGLPTEANLIGKFTGTNVDPKLTGMTSLNDDKCLSFAINADVMSPDDGWKAIVRYVKMNDLDLAVTDLAIADYVKQGQAAKAQVTLTNKGLKDLQSGVYTVRLHHGDKVIASAPGAALAAGSKTTVELEFTPAELGAMEGLYATADLDGDQNTADNTSAQVKTTVIDKDSEVIRIGDTTPSLAVAPMSFFNTASIAESLYPASAIPQVVNGKYISSLSFFYEGSQPYKDVNVEIYVGETDVTDLKDNCITADKLTKAWEGKVELTTGTHELAFQLTNPVKYTGRNLIVLVNKWANGSDQMGISFYGSYYYGEAEYSRFGNAEEKFDPTAQFGYSGVMRPDLKMVCTGSAGVEDITVDEAADGPATYYNLQGIRVDGDNLTPGVYIRRSGNTSAKVLIK